MEIGYNFHIGMNTVQTYSAFLCKSIIFLSNVFMTHPGNNVFNVRNIVYTIMGSY